MAKLPQMIIVRTIQEIILNKFSLLDEYKKCIFRVHFEKCFKGPCEQWCDSLNKDHNKIQTYVRRFHKQDYIPYGLQLSDESFEIGAGLILAHVKCFDHSLKRIKNIIGKELSISLLKIVSSLL